jgi:hypothetical protein
MFKNLGDGGLTVFREFLAEALELALVPRLLVIRVYVALSLREREREREREESVCVVRACVVCVGG